MPRPSVAMPTPDRSGGTDNGTETKSEDVVPQQHSGDHTSQEDGHNEGVSPDGAKGGNTSPNPVQKTEEISEKVAESDTAENEEEKGTLPDIRSEPKRQRFEQSKPTEPTEPKAEAPVKSESTLEDTFLQSSLYQLLQQEMNKTGAKPEEYVSLMIKHTIEHSDKADKLRREAQNRLEKERERKRLLDPKETMIIKRDERSVRPKVTADLNQLRARAEPRRAAMKARARITRQAIYEASIDPLTGMQMNPKVEDSLSPSEEAKWLDYKISCLPLERVEPLLLRDEDFPEWVVKKLVDRVDNIQYQYEEIQKMANDPNQKDERIFEVAKRIRPVDPFVPIETLREKVTKRLSFVEKKFEGKRTLEQRVDVVMHMDDDELFELFNDRENIDHLIMRVADAIASGELIRPSKDDAGDLNSDKLRDLIKKWEVEHYVYTMNMSEIESLAKDSDRDDMQARLARKIVHGPKVTFQQSTLTPQSDSVETVYRTPLSDTGMHEDNTTEGFTFNEKTHREERPPLSHKVFNLLDRKRLENENNLNRPQDQVPPGIKRIPPTQSRGKTTITREHIYSDPRTHQSSAQQRQQPPVHQPKVSTVRNEFYNKHEKENPSKEELLQSELEREKIRHMEEMRKVNQEIGDLHKQKLQESRDVKHLLQQQQEMLDEQRALFKRQQDELEVLRRNQQNARARERDLENALKDKYKPPLLERRQVEAEEPSSIEERVGPKPKYESTPTEKSRENEQYHARINVPKEDLKALHGEESNRKSRYRETSVPRRQTHRTATSSKNLDTRFDDNLRERYREKLRQAYNRREDLQLARSQAVAQAHNSDDRLNRQMIERYDELLIDVDKDIDKIQEKLDDVIKVQASMYPSLEIPRFGGGAREHLDYKDIRAYVGPRTDLITSDEERLIYIWGRLIEYGERRNWDEEDFKEGLSCCVDPTMSKVYRTHRDGSLQEILSALAERFINEDTLQETLKRVREFTRKAGEPLSSAISRVHELIDKVLIIYPPDDRDARKNAMLEEAVRSVCSPEAKMKIDEAIVARRSEGGYMRLKDYMKIASLHESRTELPSHEMNTTLQVYATELKKNAGTQPFYKPRASTPYPGKGEVSFQGSRSNSQNRGSRPGSQERRQSMSHAGGQTQSHAGGQSQSHAGGQSQNHAGGQVKTHAGGFNQSRSGSQTRTGAGGGGSSSRSQSRERGSGQSNQDGSGRSRSRGRTKPLKFGTDDKGICEACNSPVPHTARQCYVLGKYLARSESSEN